MASDLQFTFSDTGYKWKGKQKMFMFDPHQNTYTVSKFIIGFAGAAGDIITAAQFFTDPDSFKTPPRVKDLLGLVLTQNKEIYMFDDYRKWIRMDASHAAIGSGGAFALGAITTGATPVEAVRVAMKHDAYTGMGVKELGFG